MTTTTVAEMTGIVRDKWYSEFDTEGKKVRTAYVRVVNAGPALVLPPFSVGTGFVCTVAIINDEKKSTLELKRDDAVKIRDVSCVLSRRQAGGPAVLTFKGFVEAFDEKTEVQRVVRKGEVFGVS